MNIKLIDLNRQHDPIKKQILEETEKVIDKSAFIMGENVLTFEEEFSKYLGVKHSISVANGTDALVIALKALGIKEGDEVITTPYSFFATSEAIVRVGATPVFVDVKKDTYVINEELIEEKITDKTKAILPVHIFGYPCNMDRINEIAKNHNLYVLEDACQAVGSTFKGGKIGNLSDIACFSFFPTKNLGCIGDGGIITTNDDNLATLCRAFRTHGSGKDGQASFNYLNNIKEEVKNEESTGDNTVYNPLKYSNYLIGYNSRLDEIQAIVLRIKLPLLEKYNNERIELAKYYNEQLKDTSLVLPTCENDYKHVYHLYILQSSKREELCAYLKEKGIATGIYYQVPLHLQKAMLKYNYVMGTCPVAENLSNRTFAIPLYVGMTDEERKYITDTIKEWDKING